VQDANDGRGQVVEAKRRRADRIAHFFEAEEDPFDLGMIAQRNRYEADAARVCARR
jgi:hypothetical protein